MILMRKKFPKNKQKPKKNKICAAKIAQYSNTTN
jgi:hypothetical protein